MKKEAVSQAGAGGGSIGANGVVKVDAETGTPDGSGGVNAQTQTASVTASATSIGLGFAGTGIASNAEIDAPVTPDLEANVTRSGSVSVTAVGPNNASAATDVTAISFGVSLGGGGATGKIGSTAGVQATLGGTVASGGPGPGSAKPPNHRTRHPQPR